ncbi:MAG: 2Fe-2S iron-sulfur cluster binding domain-containing protein [Candidatus Promineifilaceae bacterium]|nr:2Fe-2S iron-sulfur cluster binding domain-containing protein [Candidatus Promineifilaceae bacterium]
MKQSRPATQRVRVRTAEGWRTLAVPRGSNLRRALLEAGVSPYTALTRRANCGGRGLCATCGVHIDSAPSAEHWHDKLAQRFGYPRLSCQITVENDLTVRLLPEKWIWGQRRRPGS